MTVHESSCKKNIVSNRVSRIPEAVLIFIGFCTLSVATCQAQDGHAQSVPLAATPRRLLVLRDHSVVSAHSDGSIWHVDAQRKAASFLFCSARSYIASLRASADEKYLAVVHDEGAHVISLTDHRELTIPRVVRNNRHALAVIFSNDKTRELLALDLVNGRSSKFLIGESAARESTELIRLANPLSRLGTPVSFDATLATCESNGIVHLRDTKGTIDYKFDLSKHTVYSYSYPHIELAFGESQNQIVYGTQSGRIGVLNTLNNEIESEINLMYSVRSLCFLPGRKQIAVGAGERVFIVNADNKQLTLLSSMKSDDFIICLAASPDETFMVFSDGSSSLHYLDLPDRER